MKRFFQNFSLTIGFFADSFFGKLSPLRRVRELNISNVSGGLMAIIAGLIGLMVFSTITPNLNTSVIGSSTMNLISMIPVVVAGAVIISLITTIFSIHG